MQTKTKKTHYFLINFLTFSYDFPLSVCCRGGLASVCRRCRDRLRGARVEVGMLREFKDLHEKNIN